MAFPNNVDLSLGSLGPLIVAAISETGETPSQFVRRAIAAQLGVEPPDIRMGNPGPFDGSEMARKRWGKVRFLKTKKPRK